MKLKIGIILILCTLLISARAACPWDDLSGLTNFSTILSTLNEGDDVTLADVFIDSSMPFVLGAITITGRVVVDPTKNTNINIFADIIYVKGGQLIVGTSECPIPINTTVTFELSNRFNKSNPIFGTKVLGVMGNTSVLWMYGSYRTPAWTNLEVPAVAGSTNFTLKDPVTWTAGDLIVVSSSDFDHNQYEELTVTNVSNDGKIVTFTPALQYLHWGGLARTRSGVTVDESASVAMLNRNIKLQSDNVTDANGFGYDLKIISCAPSGAHVHAAECTRGGKQTFMGTYPLHFHVMKDLGRYGSFVDNSVHHNYQRCITVHATNNSLVQNNVCHNTFGHGIFMEEGSEQNNTFIHNLVLTTRQHPKLLLPTDMEPSNYWITNPMNTYINNTAAGSDSKGFWLAFPEHPSTMTYTLSICPVHSPLGTFEGNIAHSCVDGLFLDGGPDNNTFVALPTNYTPREIPCDPSSPQVNATITNFTAFKNRVRGSWSSGSGIVFDGLILADNLIGITDASNTLGSYCFDCHFIGITNNKGTPTTPCEVAGGRSFADHKCAYPIRGFEFYDGPRALVSGTCAGFIPNGVYEASCISVLRFDNENVTPYSYVGDFDIKDGSKAVFFEPDFGDGVSSVAFIDKEGSITGFIGGTVSFNNNFLYRTGCINVTDSNAFFCPSGNNVGSIFITNTFFEENCPDFNPTALINQTIGCNRTLDRIISTQQVVYGDKPTFRIVRNDLPYYTHNLIGDVDGDSGSSSNFPSVDFFTTTLLNQSLSAYWSFQIPPRFYVSTDSLSATPFDFVEMNFCIPENVEILSVQRYFTTNDTDTASFVPQFPANSNVAFNATAPGSFYQVIEFPEFQILRYRLGFNEVSNFYLNLDIPLNTLYTDCNFGKLVVPPSTSDPIRGRPTTSPSPKVKHHSSDDSTSRSDSSSDSHHNPNPHPHPHHRSSNSSSSASSITVSILLIISVLVIYL